MTHNKYMGIYVDFKLDISLFLPRRSSRIDIKYFEATAQRLRCEIMFWILQRTFYKFKDICIG